MTVEEMLKLIDAGFTAAEIKQMKSAPAPEPEKQPEPEPEKPQAEEKPDMLAPLLKEIQELKRAVYAVNVLNSNQPEPPTVDSVLDKIMKGGQ